MTCSLPSSSSTSPLPSLASPSSSKSKPENVKSQHHHPRVFFELLGYKKIVKCVASFLPTPQDQMNLAMANKQCFLKFFPIARFKSITVSDLPVIFCSRESVAERLSFGKEARNNIPNSSSNNSSNSNSSPEVSVEAEASITMFRNLLIRSFCRRKIEMAGPNEKFIFPAKEKCRALFLASVFECMEQLNLSLHEIDFWLPILVRFDKELKMAIKFCSLTVFMPRCFGTELGEKIITLFKAAKAAAASPKQQENDASLDNSTNSKNSKISLGLKNATLAIVNWLREKTIYINFTEDDSSSNNNIYLSMSRVLSCIRFMDLFPKLRHPTFNCCFVDPVNDESESAILFLFKYLSERKININQATPLSLEESSSLSLYQLTYRHYLDFFTPPLPCVREEQEAADSDRKKKDLSSVATLPPSVYITRFFDVFDMKMSSDAFSRLFPLKETFPNINSFHWRMWIPPVNKENHLSLLNSVIPMIQFHSKLTSFRISDVFLMEEDEDSYRDPADYDDDEESDEKLQPKFSQVDKVQSIDYLCLESVHMAGLCPFDLSVLFPNVSSLQLNGVTYQAISDCMGYPASWSRKEFAFSRLKNLHIELGWNSWSFCTSQSLWIAYWYVFHEFLQEKHTPTLESLDLVILDFPPAPFLFSWFYGLKERFMKLKRLSVTVVVLDCINNSAGNDKVSNTDNNTSSSSSNSSGKGAGGGLTSANASALNSYHMLRFLWEEWESDFDHLEEFNLMAG